MAEVEGEIGVGAAVGGRRITLDPIETIPVTAVVRRVESTIPCGFQVHWFEGESEGVKYDLAAGAGMGSRWLTMHVGGRSYCVDMSEWFEKFLREVIDDEEAATEVRSEAEEAAPGVEATG